MGVATLSGLIPTFLEPTITPIITRPAETGAGGDLTHWEQRLRYATVDTQRTDRTVAGG